MTNRLIIDIDSDNSVLVTSSAGEASGHPLGKPFMFSWPLDADVMEDLRWYLEDYLRTPFGVYEQRGVQIQSQLRTWGVEIFSSLLGSTHLVDAYRQLRRSGGDFEISLRSSSPTILSLPWELMWDPDAHMPIAMELAGLTRSIPNLPVLQEEALINSGQKFRILMVITRPKGAANIRYRMIARPLLERLQEKHVNVELTVLRPPTIEKLSDSVAAAAEMGQPFHLVHFDGHGTIQDAISSPETWEAALYFERLDGGIRRVTASRLAQVLQSGEVPIAVFNACQSGTIGTNLQATIATRLLQEKTASIVAMAYSVYAETAAEFMNTFYQQLFSHAPISAAVAAARRRLFEHDRRPSLTGDRPLADWLVPVHYLREDVRFNFTPVQGQEPSVREELSDNLSDPLETKEAFYGRDSLFYELERSARQYRVTLLHGQAGIGKTELAKAFGRWWRDTGGVGQRDWIFYHSFMPGAPSFGFETVVNEIGLHFFGISFMRRSYAERHSSAKELIRSNRMLLLWDNFETIRSMPVPDDITAQFDDTACDDIEEFLRTMSDPSSASALLMTSRSDEKWLGPLSRIEVRGLDEEEAVEYADHLLASYPEAADRRQNRTLGELIEWLHGHPLSMQLVLPCLRTQQPQELLDGLRGMAMSWEEPRTAIGRSGSLAASLAYSFDSLSASNRQRMVIASLLGTIIDIAVLSLYSQDSTAPEVGGVSNEEWRLTLNSAASAGLLTHLGDGIYQAHPELPIFLTERWIVDSGPAFEVRRDRVLSALLTAVVERVGSLARLLRSSEYASTIRIITRERQTFNYFLRYAIDSRRWPGAGKIIELLNRHANNRGQYEEIGSWIELALTAVAGHERIADLESPGGEFWLLLMNMKASQERRSERLADAEATCNRILAIAVPSTIRQREAIGGAHIQLGILAFAGRRLEESAGQYTKALEIFEQVGDKGRQAIVLHQLGVIADDLNKFLDAERWFRRALAIEEEIGDWQGVADTSSELGQVCMHLENYEAAMTWHRKALALHLSHENDPGIGQTYTQLGLIDKRQGRLDEASENFRKSLVIKRRLNDRAGMSRTYMSLGELAHLRRDYLVAVEWNERALELAEEVGDVLQRAFTMGNLAMLAEDMGNSGKALEWIVRSTATFGDFDDPLNAEGRQVLVRLVSVLGVDALTECWRAIAGADLPVAIRRVVSSSELSCDRY